MRTDYRLRATIQSGSLVGILVLLSFAGTLPADQPAKKADDPLRAKLDDDLFGDIKPSDKPAPPIEKQPANPAKPSAEANPDKKPSPAPKGGDDDLRRSLEPDRGEDFGAEKPANPLIEIGARMEAVRKRLTAGDASADTQREEERIIEELTRLMEQAQQQQKKKSSSKNSQTGSKPQPKPGDMQPMPGGPGDTGDPNTTSKKPADDSTERVGATKSDAAAGVPREVLVKKAWGHLPPRLREQLINTPLDRFLPEYEQLIEDYFRRLAEERAERP